MLSVIMLTTVMSVVMLNVVTECRGAYLFELVIGLNLLHQVFYGRDINTPAYFDKYNIRLGWKYFPVTNALAYFASQWRSKILLYYSIIIFPVFGFQVETNKSILKFKIENLCHEISLAYHKFMGEYCQRHDTQHNDIQHSGIT